MLDSIFTVVELTSHGIPMECPWIPVGLHRNSAGIPLGIHGNPQEWYIPTIPDSGECCFCMLSLQKNSNDSRASKAYTH